MNAQVKVEASLASAMAAAFAKIEAATKSANNPHFKSKYADLGSVIDAIKPALVEHGLFFTQQPTHSDGAVAVETVLRHASGEAISLGTVVVPVNKNDAQAYGSALTYARRYGLVTAFGVPTEDDDGNAASLAPPRGQTQGAKVSPGSAKPITDEQVVRLQNLQKASKANPVGFNQFFNIPDLPNLPADRFQEAVDMLEGKLKKLVDAETNAKAAEHAA